MKEEEKERKTGKGEAREGRWIGGDPESREREERSHSRHYLGAKPLEVPLGVSGGLSQFCQRPTEGRIGMRSSLELCRAYGTPAAVQTRSLSTAP